MAKIEIAAERFFHARFREHADAASAKAQQAYMKTELQFHGVDAKMIRTTAAEFVRAHELDRGALRVVAEHLFATDWFDLRSAAIVVLDRRRKQLDRADFDWLIGLVRIARCWAHVDYLSTKVVGHLVGDPPSEPVRIRAWAVDAELWVRRTALLCQHDQLSGGGGDFALWTEIAVPMLPETSFWIRKALGWVLRAVSKKRPELTAGFLRAHGDACSGLTRREASKYVPARLLTASPAAAARPAAARPAPSRRRPSP
jgi:3-methyladenine DNA glycosylase AlkD